MDSILEITFCSRCGNQEADPNLKTYREYCKTCWKEINQKRSDTMKAKHIKRSNATRAAMSASKKANKKTDRDRWILYFNYYREQLDKIEKLKKQDGLLNNR